jgi:hypothetical protein
MYKRINTLTRENFLTGYRLGDMVRWRGTHGGLNYHLTNYPNSIASEYLKKTIKTKDFKTLFNIFKKRSLGKVGPDKNTLVIHLRIGDVIDNSKYSVDEHLEQGKFYGTRIYVKPLSYYQNIIKKIQKFPINKIILVGGYHTDSSHEKSSKYIERIKTFFNGYSLETRINNLPDDDFIFMGSASYFVPSGGGFSLIISEMVKMNGGLIIEE